MPLYKYSKKSTQVQPEGAVGTFLLIDVVLLVRVFVAQNTNIRHTYTLEKKTILRVLNIEKH